MFLVPLVVFLGVKYGFPKSCLCKRNDKYEVWLVVDDTLDGENNLEKKTREVSELMVVSHPR